MKRISELKFESKKDKKMVIREINNWINHFITLAAGREGNVYKGDILGNPEDIFYFTDCQDILQEQMESRGVEHNKRIRRRKDYVRYQLVLKSLLAEIPEKENLCSHCGSKSELVSCEDGYGYFNICTKCKKIGFSSYPGGLDSTLNAVKKYLGEI